MIHGDKSSYQTKPNYYRYHLVMPSVPRETLSMQYMAGGDNNRTPVIFRVPDIYRFVGHQRPGYFKMVVVSLVDQPREGRCIDVPGGPGLYI